MESEVLERLTDTCWRDFSYECKGCDHYRERIKAVPFFTLIVPFYTELMGAEVIKECKKYHKKIIERS